MEFPVIIQKKVKKVAVKKKAKKGKKRSKSPNMQPQKTRDKTKRQAATPNPQNRCGSPISPDPSYINLLLQKSLERHKQEKEDEQLCMRQEQQERENKALHIQQFNKNTRIDNYTKFKQASFRPSTPWGVDQRPMDYLRIHTENERVRKKRRKEREQALSAGRKRIGLGGQRLKRKNNKPEAKLEMKVENKLESKTDLKAEAKTRDEHKKKPRHQVLEFMKLQKKQKKLQDQREVETKRQQEKRRINELAELDKKPTRIKAKPKKRKPSPEREYKLTANQHPKHRKSSSVDLLEKLQSSFEQSPHSFYSSDIEEKQQDILDRLTDMKKLSSELINVQEVITIQSWLRGAFMVKYTHSLRQHKAEKQEEVRNTLREQMKWRMAQKSKLKELEAKDLEELGEVSARLNADPEIIKSFHEIIQRRYQQIELLFDENIEAIRQVLFSPREAFLEKTQQFFQLISDQDKEIELLMESSSEGFLSELDNFKYEHSEPRSQSSGIHEQSYSFYKCDSCTRIEDSSEPEIPDNISEKLDENLEKNTHFERKVDENLEKNTKISISQELGNFFGRNLHQNIHIDRNPEDIYIQGTQQRTSEKRIDQGFLDKSKRSFEESTRSTHIESKEEAMKINANENVEAKISAKIKSNFERELKRDHQVDIDEKFARFELIFESILNHVQMETFSECVGSCFRQMVSDTSCINDIIEILIYELIHLEIKDYTQPRDSEIEIKGPGPKDPLVAIEYMDEVVATALIDRSGIEARLLTPFNSDSLETLDCIRLNKQTHTVEHEPILPLRTFELVQAMLEDRLRELSSRKDLEYFIKAERIHNKMMFDALNLCLDQHRAYGLKGLPPPWSSVYRKCKNKVNLFEVLYKTREEINEWSFTQAGKIPSPELLFISGSLLQHIREEKLANLLTLEVLDFDTQWTDIENEEVSVQIDVSDIVLNELVTELISIL